MHWLLCQGKNLPHLHEIQASIQTSIETSIQTSMVHDAVILICG